jgi:hypothetical protein
MPDAEKILRLIGPDAMRRLIDGMGGERVYVPTRIPDPERYDKIIHTFEAVLQAGATTMSAYQSASAESGLSVRRVQEIVATHRI